MTIAGFLLLVATAYAFGQKHSDNNKALAYDYATRLASLLEDVTGKAVTDLSSLKPRTVDATALANKIYNATRGERIVRQWASGIRKTVREMRYAAYKGDSNGAKAAAAQALPFVNQIIDWSRQR